MTVLSKAEATLIAAKAECFKVCGKLGPEAHEAHRAKLEAAYLAFQQAGGADLGSNPAKPGKTQLKAKVTVDSGFH